MLKRFKDFGIITCMLVMVILFVLTTTSSHADEIPVTWDRPTLYEDGKTLPLSEIAYYELRYVNILTGSVKTKKPKAKLNGYLLIGLTTGIYRLDIRTYATNKRWSEWSPSVVAVTRISIPKPTQ